MKLEFIREYAKELVALFKPCCIRIEIAGSIRRQKEECKDIELVCIPDRWKLEVYLKGLANKGRIIFKKNGQAYKQFKWRGIMIDLFIAHADNWGWIFMLRTGSKNYNIRLVNALKKRYGIVSKNGYLYNKAGEKLTIREEQEVFDLLKCNFIEPVNRSLG
jgi:DNA polymerase (family 10)